MAITKRRRRWLRWALWLTLIAGLAVWMTRARWYGVAVEVTSPTRGELLETVVVSGRVLAPAKLELGSPILGTARAVSVELGERVAQGQVLVTLVDDEAKAALARAEAALAALAASRADLDKRRAPTSSELVRQAKANLAQAEQDLTRDRSLARDGALTAAELGRSETAVALAKSKLRAAELEARATRDGGPADATLAAQEAEARAAVEAAKVRLGQHTITAPKAGVVLARSVEPGEVVSPGAPLFVLAEDGPARLVIEPDEKNLAKLALGQHALASADAFPDQRFPATLTFIAASIDPRRGTVEVHLTPEAPPTSLRPDMTVSVEIEVSRKADALTVPRELVRDLASPAPWVLVAEDGRATKAPVTLGLRGDERVEILSGLTAASALILQKPAVQEGAKVRLPAPKAP